MLGPPPTPRIPRPVIWRPRPQRAMTIAAGFVCSDGVLLASDTLYSGTARLQYGPKFWRIDWGEVVLVFGGAGPVAALRRARDEIKQRAHATQDLTDVIRGVEDSIQVVQSILNPTNAWEDKLHALVGVRANGARAFTTMMAAH